jgi:hypothetical protein
MTETSMLAFWTKTLLLGPRECTPFYPSAACSYSLDLQRFSGKARIDENRESIKKHWSP